MQEIGARKGIDIWRVPIDSHKVGAQVADDSQDEGQEGEHSSLEAKGVGPSDLLAEHIFSGHGGLLDLHNRYLI